MHPIVKCPTCNRELEWSSASPYRPFCSERCKLIDLGAWLSEARSIAGEKATQESLAETSLLSRGPAEENEGKE